MARSELDLAPLYLLLEHLIMMARTMSNRASIRLSISTLVMALGICAGLVACGGGEENNAGQVGAQPPPPISYVYVASTGDNKIYTYALNQDGTLTPTGSILAGTYPEQIAFHPSHRFAYVANSISHDISMYQVNPKTGALSPLAPLGILVPPVQIFTNPVSITVDPKGRFAYTANGSGTSVSCFTIDQSSGALSFVETIPIGNASSKETFAVTVDPAGQFVYVGGGDPISPFSGNVLQTFRIDQTSGRLTPITPNDIIPALAIPLQITFHPTKPFVYVATGFEHRVTAYLADAATGTLTQVGDSLDTGGTAARAVVVERSGRFAYVVDLGYHQVAAFSIDPMTGSLTPLGSPYPLPDNNGGRFLAVDPSGQFLLATSDTASSFVSVLRIEANGTLTPLPEHTVPAGSGSIGITAISIP